MFVFVDDINDSCGGRASDLADTEEREIAA
jgi:hypothetical protein